MSGDTPYHSIRGNVDFSGIARGNFDEAQQNGSPRVTTHR